MMIQITRIEKTGGPLTKRIWLSEDGRLVSDGGDYNPSIACPVEVDTEGRIGIRHKPCLQGRRV